MAVQYQFKNPASSSATTEAENAMLRYFLGRRIVLPETEAPEVSIVIPVFNQYRYTMACLQSLVTACRGKTAYEVILADDASTDETCQIAQQVENLRVVSNASGEHGFLPNVNFAASQARGKYLFLLNNDTLLLGEGELLDAMTSHFQSPDVGVVGCRLLRTDGSFYDCGRIVLSDGSLMNLSPAPNRGILRTFESDIVEGSAMMVRLDAWREFGGFDPVFGRGYFEESDLCLKIKTRKNQRVITDLKNEIIHFGKRTFSQNGDSQSLFSRNAGIFMKRWHDYLAGREADLLAADRNSRALELWRKLYSK